MTQPDHNDDFLLDLSEEGTPGFSFLDTKFGGEGRGTISITTSSRVTQYNY